MLSAEEVYESVMVSSRSSGERLSVPNGGLSGSGGGGIRYAKLLVADDGSRGRETMVKNSVAVDAQSEGERDRDAERILRFQSEVVTRGGPRLLSHRV